MMVEPTDQKPVETIMIVPLSIETGDAIMIEPMDIPTVDSTQKLNENGPVRPKSANSNGSKRILSHRNQSQPIDDADVDLKIYSTTDQRRGAFSL